MLQESMSAQVKLYYAMKANSHKKGMNCIRSHTYISGIEIASSGEIGKALRYFDCRNIIFMGPGKTDYELEQAIVNNIKFINIEKVIDEKDRKYKR